MNIRDRFQKYMEELEKFNDNFSFERIDSGLSNSCYFEVNFDNSDYYNNNLKIRISNHVCKPTYGNTYGWADIEVGNHNDAIVNGAVGGLSILFSKWNFLKMSKTLKNKILKFEEKQAAIALEKKELKSKQEKEEKTALVCYLDEKKDIILAYFNEKKMDKASFIEFWNNLSKGQKIRFKKSKKFGYENVIRVAYFYTKDF